MTTGRMATLDCGRGTSRARDFVVAGFTSDRDPATCARVGARPCLSTALVWPFLSINSSNFELPRFTDDETGVFGDSGIPCDLRVLADGGANGRSGDQRGEATLHSMRVETALLEASLARRQERPFIGTIISRPSMWVDVGR